MKHLLAAFLMINTFALKAQLNTFPTHIDNPIWGYYSEGGYLTTPEFKMYGLIGDTIINAENYSKLYSLTDTILHTSSVKEFLGGIRVSGESVFYYNAFNNNEELLYDFSGNLNDIIILNGFHENAIIYDIDSITINEKIHKRFYLKNDSEGTGEWIENIGSVHGLLSSLIYPSDNNPPTTSLVCFKYQNVNYYPNFNCNCFDDYLLNTSAVEEKININRLNIFPNPITDESIVRSSELILDISIFSISGSLVQTRVINSEIYNLGTETLKPGVYFLYAKMQSGIIYSTKFIKGN
jgi:hypothetical protein